MTKVSAIARCFSGWFGRRMLGCTLFKRDADPRQSDGQQKITDGDKKAEHCPLPQCDVPHMRCSLWGDKR
jgi:hypothetical protein